MNNSTTTTTGESHHHTRPRITAELTDENLCFHNFEWLASSAYSFGFAEPRLQNRIVKIPIHFDDFPMYHGIQRPIKQDASANSSERPKAVGGHGTPPRAP